MISETDMKSSFRKAYDFMDQNKDIAENTPEFYAKALDAIRAESSGLARRLMLGVIEYFNDEVQGK